MLKYICLALSPDFLNQTNYAAIPAQDIRHGPHGFSVFLHTGELVSQPTFL